MRRDEKLQFNEGQRLLFIAVKLTDWIEGQAVQRDFSGLWNIVDVGQSPKPGPMASAGKCWEVVAMASPLATWLLAAIQCHIVTRCGSEHWDTLGSHGHGLPTGNLAAGCHSMSHCHAMWWQALGHAGKPWPRPRRCQFGCQLLSTVTSSRGSCDAPAAHIRSITRGIKIMAQIGDALQRKGAHEVRHGTVDYVGRVRDKWSDA